MPRVEINITGQTHLSRSRPLSSQRTQNLYSEVVDVPGAKSNYVLHGFPGLSLAGTVSGASRGMFVHKGVLYRVAGTLLYSVDAAGTHATLGTIAGSGRCIFDAMGDSVIIVNGGVVYEWDQATLTTVSDADLETPNSATHINQQMIYDGDGARFVSSNVGDAATIDGLNYATAESKPDDLVRVYAFDQVLYLMGEDSIEPWWNSGIGSPPFERIEGGLISVGLGALHSVSNNAEAMYWLGSDLHVYRLQGGQAQRVTSTAIHGAIDGLSETTDGVGFCFDLEGQRFYALTFPVADETFLYSDQTGWTTLSSDGGRWYGSAVVTAYRNIWVEDYRNGNLYLLDLDTYTDNGDAIIRIRDTAPLHGGLFGAPGRRVEMDEFELILETGVGLLSGQGSDPKVALSFSDDGGRTFGTERWAGIGAAGQFQYRVNWRALGSFVERILRVRISDPVKVSIHSAAAEIEVGV